ncbi:MAG: PEP-CTERM sorting domain-containing protein [Phycisphaerae bacterium]
MSLADIRISTGAARGCIRFSRNYDPGDANRDGIADMEDHIVWFNNFGQTAIAGVSAANWRKADFNGDGIVDMNDYITWFDHYGEDQNAFAADGGTVPEPAALSVLALGAVFAVRPRRRRRKK